MKLTLLPETTEAFLASAGLFDRRATRHVYSHSEQRVAPDVERTVHMFRCTETNTLRIWGSAN